MAQGNTRNGRTIMKKNRYILALLLMQVVVALGMHDEGKEEYQITLEDYRGIKMPRELVENIIRFQGQAMREDVEDMNIVALCKRVDSGCDVGKNLRTFIGLNMLEFPGRAQDLINRSKDHGESLEKLIKDRDFCLWGNDRVKKRGNNKFFLLRYNSCVELYSCMVCELDSINEDRKRLEIEDLGFCSMFAQKNTDDLVKIVFSVLANYKDTASLWREINNNLDNLAMIQGALGGLCESVVDMSAVSPREKGQLHAMIKQGKEVRIDLASSINEWIGKYCSECGQEKAVIKCNGCNCNVYCSQQCQKVRARLHVEHCQEMRRLCSLDFN